jgi:hypothetical protein
MSDYKDYGDEEADIANSIQDALSELFNNWGDNMKDAIIILLVVGITLYFQLHSYGILWYYYQRGYLVVLW